MFLLEGESLLVTEIFLPSMLTRARLSLSPSIPIPQPAQNVPRAVRSEPLAHSIALEKSAQSFNQPA
jgi:hypothetical protein